MHKSIITRTDSYKYSHYLLLPEDTKMVYSYIESRKGLYPYNIFFGMQAYLQKYLATPFTREDIDIAEHRVRNHINGLTFNRAGWEHILNKHGGYLPLCIRALKEGIKIPVGNVMATVMNTDQKVPWLPGHVETTMLRLWYPTTVATRSYHIKQIIRVYLERTADSLTGLPFMLHDFGMRGNSSEESAGISGAAHLVNFMGTDTMDALDWIDEYYHMETAGYSIPASEHSTMTIYGRRNEIDAYRASIRAFGKPGMIFANVADSYNIFEVCRYLLPQLKQELIDSGATMVVRPDSGDPLVVLPQIFEHLENVFGCTINSKGYKVLQSVKVIWGDGINETTIIAILEYLITSGYSVENMAFGCGGYLVQDLTRDTQGFAMKASAALCGDTWIELHKDPITDPGKKSKSGMVTTYQNDFGEYHTSLWFEGTQDALQTVYLNGELMNKTTFTEIRERVNTEVN